MLQEPVEANEYFRAHKSRVRTFLVVSTAVPLEEGDPVLSQDFKLAPGNGYEADGLFIPKEALGDFAIDMTGAPLPGAPRELPPGTVVTPIPKGMTAPAFAQEPGARVTRNTYQIEALGMAPMLLDEIEMSAMFNYHGRRLPPTPGLRLLALRGVKPYRGILMPEDTLLTFPSCPVSCLAEKSALLYVDKKDPDGLNFLPPEAVLQMLRQRQRPRRNGAGRVPSPSAFIAAVPN